MWGTVEISTGRVFDDAGIILGRFSSNNSRSFYTNGKGNFLSIDFPKTDTAYPVCGLQALDFIQYEGNTFTELDNFKTLELPTQGLTFHVKPEEH